MLTRVPHPVHLSVAVALLALAVLSGRGARAQTGATFAYQPVFKGWNLIGFFPPPEDVVGPVYSLQPGDRDYQAPSSSLGPGAGYWAYYSDDFGYRLGLTSVLQASATIPAGQCVMVGNPSRTGSARVTGAGRTYVFSAVLNSYLEEDLIPIGRGAWACNDGDAAADVRIADRGDTVDLSSNWPECCSPEPISNDGLARVVVENDTPYPLIVALRQIDDNGDAVPVTDISHPGFWTVLPACTACSEYTDHPACSPNATRVTKEIDAGRYTLHLQTEGPNVPDVVASSLQLQGYTQYSLCPYVDANRPQKGS